SSLAAAWIRFLVAGGMERDDGALLRTADTVPGVSPKCWATVLSVTTAGFLRELLSWPMISHPEGASSSFCVTLTVWFRPAESVEKDVQIAEGRNDECVVNALAPAQFALGHRGIVGMINCVSNLADDPGNRSSPHNCSVQ